MSVSGTRSSRGWQRGCARLLTAILLTQAMAPLGFANTPRPSIEGQVKELESLAAFSADVRRTLDRAAFDVEALLDTLDYDAGKIVDFVRDEIAFEQYPGLLRGPEGTLASRSGNALDQAVLLAKLLREAGHDARVARASLSDQQAHALLAQMQRKDHKPSPIGDAEAAFRAYVKHGAVKATDAGARAAVKELFEPLPVLADAQRTEAGATADFIRKQLGEKGVTLGKQGAGSGGRGDEALLQEARDYFWVQSREKAASPWQDLHPVFENDRMLAGLKFATTFGEQVPKELLHRLRIRLFVERWKDGVLEAFPVSDAWERPVANLWEKPITVGVIPNTLLNVAGTSPDIERIVEKAEFFVPLLMDEVAPGAVFFDRHGNRIDPMAAAAPGAGLFASIQGAFGQAMGRLDPGKPLPSVSAQWTEFTLIAPGGAEQTHRRTTFDRIGPAARAAAAPPATLQPATPAQLRPLLERQTVMVNVGATSRALAVDRSLEYVEDSMAALLAMTRGIHRTGEITAPPANAKVSAAWPGQMTLYAKLDEAAAVSAQHRIYRSAPALVIHRSALLAEPGVLEGIDIITNPRRAVRRAGSPFLDPAVLVDVGVWETQSEGTVLNQDGKVLNTALAFEQARSQGHAAVLVMPGEALPALAASADSLQHMRNDLANGYAVIAPSAEAGLARLGWWRVDPVTGQTLGMLADGRGSAITEALVTYSNAISQAFLVVGLMGCLADAHRSGNTPAGARRGACCLASNFLLFGVGWLGGVVTTMHGTAQMGGAAARAYLARVAKTSVLFDSTTSLISVCN